MNRASRPAVHAGVMAMAAAALAAAAGCASTGGDVPNAATVTPGCTSEADSALLAARYTRFETFPPPAATMTMPDAVCSRDRLVAQLAKTMGPVVGYKAGLTNPAVQKRFNHDAPVRGTLFARMMLDDGAVVPVAYGARPVYEADLVAVVADSGIHDAKTPLEVLRHLQSIRPFIEMPDLLLEDATKVNGPFLVGANVAARLGVLGKPIAVQATPEFADALATMNVKLVDGASGAVIDAGKGSAILDNPLNAAIWLAADLKAAGIRLKPGDLLSLGSFTKLLPPKQGQTVKAVYEGLPGTPSVAVTFR